MTRKALVTALAAAGFSGLMATGAPALPLYGTPLRDAAAENPLVEQARTFCYNRSTGRFLHWGPCRRSVRPVYSRPRVYCRNRYTGRFLYWGACRR